MHKFVMIDSVFMRKRNFAETIVFAMFVTAKLRDLLELIGGAFDLAFFVVEVHYTKNLSQRAQKCCGINVEFTISERTIYTITNIGMLNTSRYKPLISRE